MRRHDGLQHVLGQVVAADEMLPSTHGSPYRLVVTVPHATLTAALVASARPQTRSAARGWAGPGRPAGTTVPPRAAGDADAGRHPLVGDEAAVVGDVVLPGLLPDGFPVSPLTVQTMACTADLVPVLVDENHQPLDVGDSQYAFPPRVRTAIITRDQGCTYPGCGAPAPWCECHHLVPFSRGGATSVDNGALLCGRHHRYVHALNVTGRVVTRDGTSRVEWNHRPTSWTATTATAPRRCAADPDAAGTGTDRADPAPVLTDRCLDQLIHRWQRRRARSRAAAA